MVLISRATGSLFRGETRPPFAHSEGARIADGGGQDAETRITKRFAHLLVWIERKVNDPYVGN